jgi:positive regulator of sigma E activity
MGILQTIESSAILWIFIMVASWLSGFVVSMLGLDATLSWVVGGLVMGFAVLYMLRFRKKAERMSPL